MYCAHYFFKSYQGKQLSAALDLLETLSDSFCRQLKGSMSPADKMLLIDGLIHECHLGCKDEGHRLFTRPFAVNLIEGSMSQVIRFLEELPYGHGTSPEMEQNLIRWRRNCLSAVAAMGEEREGIARAVERIPEDVRAEVEELIRSGRLQSARRRLERVPEFRKPMRFRRKGTLARHFVRYPNKQRAKGRSSQTA